jgi:hypothetical protein
MRDQRPGDLDLIAQVPEGIGLTRGGRAWARSIVILRALLGPRLCREMRPKKALRRFARSRCPGTAASGDEPDQR